MQKYIICCVMRLVLILLFVSFAKISIAADLYCRPIAAHNILEKINKKTNSFFPFRFTYDLALETPDEIQAVYNKIKIEKLENDDYHLVIATMDLEKLYHYRVDFNSNIQELFFNCAKINQTHCKSLALYNRHHRICLLYSVDYYRTGDGLLDSQNKLTRQLYQFGN